MDVGYRAGQRFSMVLLDWEKAFDKVDQDMLHKALDRMDVPEKYMNLIREAYKNPTFNIQIDGMESEWKKQETGIRQGCPLSPYLFLVIMSVMFHDIHQDEELETELKADRVIGSLFDEIFVRRRHNNTLHQLRSARETITQN